MRRIECVSCAASWRDADIDVSIVEGILRPRPGEEYIKINGEIVSSFGPSDYVCDQCSAMLVVGEPAAAVSGGKAARDGWWKPYIAMLPYSAER